MHSKLPKPSTEKSDSYFLWPGKWAVLWEKRKKGGGVLLEHNVRNMKNKGTHQVDMLGYNFPNALFKDGLLICVFLVTSTTWRLFFSLSFFLKVFNSLPFCKYFIISHICSTLNLSLVAYPPGTRDDYHFVTLNFYFDVIIYCLDINNDSRRRQPEHPSEGFVALLLSSLTIDIPMQGLHVTPPEVRCGTDREVTISKHYFWVSKQHLQPIWEGMLAKDLFMALNAHFLWNLLSS